MAETPAREDRFGFDGAFAWLFGTFLVSACTFTVLVLGAVGMAESHGRESRTLAMWINGGLIVGMLPIGFGISRSRKWGFVSLPVLGVLAGGTWLWSWTVDGETSPNPIALAFCAGALVGIGGALARLLGWGPRPS